MKTKHSVRKQRHRSVEERHWLVSAWKASNKAPRVRCRDQGLGMEFLRRWITRFNGTRGTVSLVEITHQAESTSAMVLSCIRITRDGKY
jgi:hypothetical protein